VGQLILKPAGFGVRIVKNEVCTAYGAVSNR
jgi:hypothetical protein